MLEVRVRGEIYLEGGWPSSIEEHPCYRISSGGLRGAATSLPKSRLSERPRRKTDHPLRLSSVRETENMYRIW